MRRQIPSTRSLLVFEAVARLHSMSKAAEELFLTQSAVSQQLRGLEEQLGVQLLHRHARGIHLTDVGRQYHSQIEGDLIRLENHTLATMSQSPKSSSLVVGSVPVLGVRWLMPRLPDFLKKHPDCTIHVREFPTTIYIEDPGFDMALHYDSLSWPGAKQHHLMPESCVVICAPASRWRSAVARSDFRQVPLLQLSSRLVAWSEWFEQADIKRKPPIPAAGHRFDMFAMLCEAVFADLGVALVPRYFVERELDDGRLIQAHPFESKSSRGYSIFVALDRSTDPLIDMFATWLMSSATDREASTCVPA